jgi:hypothetical protein
MGASALTAIARNELVIGRTITPELMAKIEAALGTDELSAVVKAGAWAGRTVNKQFQKELQAALGDPVSGKPAPKKEQSTPEADAADGAEPENGEGEEQ